MAGSSPLSQCLLDGEAYAIPLGELRDAERSPLPWAVTCRGVVDGIVIVIHMTRHEGRRFVEEAAFVNGCDAGTNTWDMQRLDRVTV